MPLLHINPSKTDEERMLVAGPELVDVLAALVKRVRDPEDVIRGHRSFIARRRQLRPGEEYREPTEEEWEEFEAHFVRRKVSLGTCGRAYGTACQHEHACVRYALLRTDPDPDQIDRLRDVITNLNDRITEAHDRGWLGEAEGLQVSPDAARIKLGQMERQLERRHGQVLLAIPTLPPA